MKSLRKLIALIGVLAIAAVLPVVSFAEDTSLTIAADKTEVAAGEEFTVNFDAAGLSEANAWNVLEFEIAYDDAQVAPQVQGSGRDAQDYVTGPALYEKSATISTNLDINPAKFGIIDDAGQYDNGTILGVVFKVAEDVEPGTEITVTVNLKNYAHSVIENKQVVENVALAEFGEYTVTVKVPGGDTTPSESEATPSESEATPSESEVAPSESEAAPSESEAAPSESEVEPTPSEVEPAATLDEAVAAAKAAKENGKEYTEESLKALDEALAAAEALGDDATDEEKAAVLDQLNAAIAGLTEVTDASEETPAATDETPAATDETPAGTDDGASNGVATGDISLYVLALVLMAGSAVALFGLKKKALSK